MLNFERERERERGVGEEQRDRETQNPKQAPAVSTEPDVGLELTSCEIMT